MSFSTLHNNPQEQSTAFDAVNSILNSQKTVSLQISYQEQSLKLLELNTLCRQLITANRGLNQQIQFLKEQLEAKAIPSTQSVFSEEYSEIQLDFTEIEQNIREYRGELERYQKNVAQQLKEKTAFVDSLKQEVAKGKEREQGLRVRIGDLENQTAALTQTKNNLLAEVQELEGQVRSSRMKSPKSFRKNFDFRDSKRYEYSVRGNAFESGVEEQLQKLIQKLIKQLQHEKYLKRKLSEENRSLQNNIIQLQKEIARKNNKIYQLQLTIIKNTKNNSSSLLSFGNNNNRVENIPRRQFREASKISKNVRRFTFMDMVNQQIKLSVKEKLTIALKTIDFYISKIQSQDYSSHALESISVTNFSLNNPKYITIKANNPTTDFEYEQTESEVAWNLAFLLENIFNQQFENSQIFADMSFLDFLGQMLEDKNANSLNTIFELRRIVENIIEDINR